MPRKARIIVPECPHHIVQRGHNRRAVFLEEGDYEYYLKNLRDWKKQLAIKVYSYCLMTNHVHLVVEPGADRNTISQLMKRLAGKQTRFVNRLKNRSGSLWEGRFKISPIQRDAYLLQCCRYVELNPVKAKMVSRAEDYKWSSYRHRIGITRSEWLDDDQMFLSLGEIPRERQSRYKQFVEEGAGRQQQLIQNAVNRNQLTGNSAFVDEIEFRIGKRIEARNPGRPRK